VFERVDHPKRRLRRTTILDVTLTERESCKVARL
jgi:LacI family transcriptional regulator